MIRTLQRKPHHGDRIGFGDFCGSGHGSVANVAEPTSASGTVIRCEENLCWYQPDGARDATLFIWYFPSDKQRNRLARIFGRDGAQIAHEYADAGKACTKCDGHITTPCLAPDVEELCVHCADYDEHDPDVAELG